MLHVPMPRMDQASGNYVRSDRPCADKEEPSWIYYDVSGVIASYEGRKCLLTISRQIPIVILTMMPMMIVCRFAYPFLGLAGSLAVGWMLFPSAFAPSAFHILREPQESSGN